MNIDVIMLSNSKNATMRDMTQKAIDSLHKSSNHHQFNVIVVETVQEPVQYNGAKVVTGQVPFNYNRNLNLGLQHCTAEWIVIANNDLIFHTDWIDPITALNPDSASPVSPGWKPHAHVNNQVIRGYRTSIELCGWCIVTKRATLDKIGPFDEQFDLFYQDNDYAAQLMRHQLTHLLVGTSHVTHLVAKSHGGYGSRETKVLMESAQKKFDEKYSKVTVCLTMMVRDEAENLRELLPQVAPFISTWSITDTGSVDDTKKVITEFFEKTGVPGELHERVWTDHYGNERTEMIKHADGKADYMLVMDADDRLHGKLEFKGMFCDSYSLRMGKEFSHWRHQLFRSGLDWRYIGSRHEYAHSLLAKTTARLQGDYWIEFRTAGFRSRNPNKYQDDAAALEKEVALDPTNARNWFYLAQSYFDFHSYTEAKRCYEKRVSLGGWPEEQFYAQWRVGQCAIALKESDEAVTAAMLRAYELRPTRAEALHTLAEYLRLKNKFALAYVFAKTAAEIPYPQQDALFLFQEVYKFKALDELAICAYYTGRVQESERIFSHLLEKNLLPPQHVERTKANLKFSRDRLAQMGV